MFTRFTQAAQGFLSHNGGPRSFNQQYQVFPVSFTGKDELEKGNKVILPPSALDSLARLEISWPMHFRFFNDHSQRDTCGGVMEFIAEEGTCYMPYWMMQNLLLKEGDIVRVISVTLPKGSFVKLQPLTKEFLDITNPRAVLEASLRHYATLSVGDNIVIRYNGLCFEIEIVELRPARSVSVIETDIEVDFAPPKDYVEPPPAPSRHPASSSSSSKNFGMNESNDGKSSSEPSPSPTDAQATENILFSGAGMRLDGKPMKASKSGKGQQSSPSKGASSNLSALDDEEDNDTAPWTRALPGGVRVQNAIFDDLMRQGKIPGRGRKMVDPKSEVSGNFDLFGGQGRTFGNE